MNYPVLIQSRKSVRSFTDKKVPHAVAQEIRAYGDHSLKRLIPELETQMYLFCDDVKAALEGAAGYHNFLVGAPQYLVLLSARDPLSGINAGYMMEHMVLYLTDRDLDTCWLTFTDSELVKQSLGIESELDVAAIIAFGYGLKTTKQLRLNIRSMSDVDILAKHRYMEPKRRIRDMVFLNTWGNTRNLESHIGFYDDMLWEAFYAASLAPSYLNRQAYGFVLHNGSISLIRRPDEFTTETDGDLSLGIVLLHFNAVAENYAGKLTWQFRSDAPDLALPEGYRQIAVCSL